MSYLRTLASRPRLTLNVSVASHPLSPAHGGAEHPLLQSLKRKIIEPPLSKARWVTAGTRSRDSPSHTTEKPSPHCPTPGAAPARVTVRASNPVPGLPFYLRQLREGSLNSGSAQEPGFTSHEQDGNCLPKVPVSRLDRGFKPFIERKISGACSASWPCQSQAHNRQAASSVRGP